MESEIIALTAAREKASRLRIHYDGNAALTEPLFQRDDKYVGFDLPLLPFNRPVARLYRMTDDYLSSPSVRECAKAAIDHYNSHPHNVIYSACLQAIVLHGIGGFIQTFRSRIKSGDDNESHQRAAKDNKYRVRRRSRERKEGKKIGGLKKERKSKKEQK